MTKISTGLCISLHFKKKILAQLKFLGKKVARQAPAPKGLVLA